ncbi:MAG: alpha/beta fold hydrolase, partial [Chloroflexota bacterium]
MEFFSDPIHQPFELGNPNGAVGALLIHGFSGTPAEMRYSGQALADAGIFAKGILLPGFGSDIANLKAQSNKTWLEAAYRAWTSFQPRFETTLLIGFSMGGAIATILAADAPPNELILMAPFTRFESRLVDIILPLAQYVKPTVSPFEFGDLDDPDFRKSLLEMVPGIDLDNEETINILKEEMVLPTKVLVGVRKLGRRA